MLGRGGSHIVSPDGQVIAGPLYGQEGIVSPIATSTRLVRAKRYFDVAGHYSRPDVLPRR